MAAILTDCLLSARPGSPPAVIVLITRALRHPSREMRATLESIVRMTLEGLTFLWMFAVVGFSVLVVAAAAGFLE